MRVRINDKKYYTDTALLVNRYAAEGLTENDLGYFECSLYQKKTGEYFIYGVGNAGSNFSSSLSNTRRAGSWIIPIPEKYNKEVLEAVSNKHFNFTLEKVTEPNLLCWHDWDGQNLHCCLVMNPYWVKHTGR